MTESERPGTRNRPIAPLALVAWSIGFGLAYSQAPLFSSNQNQYFLHGLARAGYGFLRQDWLANTVDPTPLFSWIVESTYRFLPLGAFYLWTFVLFGVYVYSLEGLASDLFGLRDDPVKHRLFLSLFIAAHSALMRFGLLKVLGDAWAYVLEGGLAGQRVLGSVVEPSMFGVLLLLSIHLFHRKKAVLSVVCAVAAATIHPTYLLTAGLLTLGYTLVMFRDGEGLRALRVPALAIVLVLPILAYSVIHFTTSVPADLAQAQDILVQRRIPHHTLIQVWWNSSALVQIAIVASGLGLARKTRLFIVLAVCAGSVVAVTAIQVLTGSQSLALIFPWRPSTILVPLGTTLVLGYLVSAVWRWANMSSDTLRRIRDLVGRASISMVVVLMLAGLAKFKIDLAQVASDPAREMMAFARREGQAGEVYMIPPYLQDFRLETGEPILVDFKSIPYRAKEVIQWYDRLLLARAFYRDQPEKVSCRALRDARTRYGVTHVVLDSAQFGADCGPWVERYRDAAFAVYELSPE